MEVFLFISDDSEIPLLERTMEAWEAVQWADPINVVQLPKHDFQIKRRALADQMAKEDYYMLCDVGCVPAPEEERCVAQIIDHVSNRVGLVGLGENIFLCAKGIVRKWPEQRTDNYFAEHVKAVQNAGKEVEVCPITYKQLPVS